MPPEVVGTSTGVRAITAVIELHSCDLAMYYGVSDIGSSAFDAA